MKQQKTETYTFTVGDLRHEINNKCYKDSDILFFGGREGVLNFYRFKYRGDKLVQLEFNESIDNDEYGNIFAYKLHGPESELRESAMNAVDLQINIIGEKIKSEKSEEYLSGVRDVLKIIDLLKTEPYVVEQLTQYLN